MLESKRIGYKIGDRHILHDINVRIEPGSFVGIIGPNGAGKTTLMRVLAGVARPSMGAVLFEGESVHGMPDRRRARAMAYMSQNPAIGFGFTVWDVVAMGRYAHRGAGPFGRLGLPGSLSGEDRRVIERALAATDVERFRDRPVTNLSGGERQRVFLARTLAQQPRLLFLDEPTSDLDIRFQLDILNLVQRLRKEQQLTVIMAIHDLTWTLRFCDTVLALQAGRVAAFGDANEVVTERLIADVFGVAAHIVREEGVPARVDFVGATVGEAGGGHGTVLHGSGVSHGTTVSHGITVSDGGTASDGITASDGSTASHGIAADGIDELAQRPAPNAGAESSADTAERVAR